MLGERDREWLEGELRRMDAAIIASYCEDSWSLE
jgi:hypothetical protein